jgi:hypothetical protein
MYISADPGRRKGERVREKDVLHCYYYYYDYDYDYDYYYYLLLLTTCYLLLSNRETGYVSITDITS